MRLHGRTPGPEKVTSSTVVFRIVGSPAFVAVVAWRVVVACVDEDIQIVVRAVAFGRDDHSNLAAVAVVVACNTVAVEHNIVVALDRSDNPAAELREDEVNPCKDFHSAACVLAVDNYEDDGLDNTYLLEGAAVAAAVAVLDPPVQVTRLIFQTLPQSSVLRALNLGSKRIAWTPKDQTVLLKTDQLRSEVPVPAPQSLRLLLPVMTFRFPWFSFNSIPLEDCLSTLRSADDADKKIKNG